MSQPLQMVRKLFDLDKEILRQRQLYEAEPKALRQLEQRLQQASTRAEQARTALSHTQAQADSKELDLKSSEAEILRLRTQLTSTRNIDNKQYKTFLSEIEGKENDKAVLEDEILALMTRTDESSEQLKGMLQTVAEREAEVEREGKRIRAELKEIEQKLAALQPQRDEAAKGIAPELLQKYDRVLRQRGETALVEIRNQTCQGCFTKLTLQRYANVAKGEEVAFCNTCGRVLVMPDEERAHFDSTATRQAAPSDTEKPIL